MGIVISQPAPAASFRDISRSSRGNDSAQIYAQLASAAQSRFASDRASAGREALGFAQLADDSAFRQAQLQQQAEEANARNQNVIGAIQERAVMEKWLLEQSMTMKEQQEYKQQQNAIVELQELHRKGLVTDEEFGLKFHGIKARVDFLGMKEQITKNKALNEQREQHAALFKSQMEREAELNKYRGMSVEDRIVFDVDHTQYEQTKAELRALKPGMDQLNAPAFELEVRERMKMLGRGRKGVIQPDGKIEWDKPAKTGAGGSAGSRQQTAPKPFNISAGKRAAEAKAELAGHTEGTEEYQAAVKKEYDALEAQHTASQVPQEEQKAQAVKQSTETQLKGKEVTAAEIQGLNIPPQAKEAAQTILAIQAKMIQQFGPYEAMTPDIKAKMDQLAGALAKIKSSAGQDNRIVRGMHTVKPGLNVE